MKYDYILTDKCRFFWVLQFYYVLYDALVSLPLFIVWITVHHDVLWFSFDMKASFIYTYMCTLIQGTGWCQYNYKQMCKSSHLSHVEYPVMRWSPRKFKIHCSWFILVEIYIHTHTHKCTHRRVLYPKI